MKVMIVEDDETLYDKISSYAEVIPLRFSYDLSSFSNEYIDKTKSLFTYYYTIDNFYNNEMLRLKKHFKHFMRYPKYLYINENNQWYPAKHITIDVDNADTTIYTEIEDKE